MSTYVHSSTICSSLEITQIPSDRLMDKEILKIVYRYTKCFVLTFMLDFVFTPKMFISSVTICQFIKCSTKTNHHYQ